MHHVQAHEAVAAGVEGDIEWGEGCDTELGLVKVPVANAAPCVEPWDEADDNGGAPGTKFAAELTKLLAGRP